MGKILSNTLGSSSNDSEDKIIEKSKLSTKVKKAIEKTSVEEKALDA